MLMLTLQQFQVQTNYLKILCVVFMEEMKRKQQQCKELVDCWQNIQKAVLFSMKSKNYFFSLPAFIFIAGVNH